jgi:hypothetical protein
MEDSTATASGPASSVGADLLLEYASVELFFAMLLGVNDRCLFCVPSGVNGVCSGRVSMVG